MNYNNFAGSAKSAHTEGGKATAGQNPTGERCEMSRLMPCRNNLILNCASVHGIQLPDMQLTRFSL
jgi:hypothetical protein